MKLSVIGLILILICGPSCNIYSNPASYTPGHHDEYSVYSVFEGKVYDKSTGNFIDSARVSAFLRNLKSYRMVDRYGYYRFNLKISEIPCTVKIIVTHPEYETDSLLDTINVKRQGREYDFYLTPK